MARDRSKETFRLSPDLHFDFNVYSRKKVIEKLHYMHANPVKEKLVPHPGIRLYTKMYTPGERQVTSALAAAIIKSTPNKNRTRVSRDVEAFQKELQHMSFLVGVLSVIPKGTVSERDAQALLVRGYEILSTKPFSLAAVQKHGLQIKKRVKQARTLTRKLDEDLTSAMAKTKRS